jgi:hypothetical protein
MKPETLKIDEVEYVRKDSIKPELVVPKGDASNPFMEPGKDYFIRTVTHYFTGRLIWVGEKELVIEDAAWIADTGRFNQFMKGETVNEVEPFPKGSRVIVARGSLIDMTERIGGLLLMVK